MADAIEIIPPNWWSIVLVGMHLPAEHPAIQVQRHRKDVPDNWRGQRVGKGKLAAAAFDNAIRAGQRERKDMFRQRPGQNLKSAEMLHRQTIREREHELCMWMASFNEVPYLVRPALQGWGIELILIKELAGLDIVPECYEYDDDSLDRVPTPSMQKAAA